MYSNDEITDAEFGALLDQLHGKGRFAVDAFASAASVAVVAEPAVSAVSDDHISEHEFEALLNELRGKGKLCASVAPVEKTP